MVVQTNMHPQVVEEAGKPLYFFFPTPRTKHRKLQMVGKVEKKPFKVFFKEKDHRAKQEAKKAINFKHHCWGKSWRRPA